MKKIVYYLYLRKRSRIPTVNGTKLESKPKKYSQLGHVPFKNHVLDKHQDSCY